MDCTTNIARYNSDIDRYNTDKNNAQIARDEAERKLNEASLAANQKSGEITSLETDIDNFEDIWNNDKTLSATRLEDHRAALEATRQAIVYMEALVEGDVIEFP